MALCAEMLLGVDAASEDHGQGREGAVSPGQARACPMEDVSPEGPFWWGALIPSVSKHPLLPRGTQGPETFPKLGPQPESETLCQMTAKTGSVLGEGYQGPLFPLLWARDEETA